MALQIASPVVVAKVRGLPLLYKGVDFTQTDVVSAVSSMPASAIPAGRS